MGGSSSTSTNSYLPGATQAATTGNAGLQSLLSSLSAKSGQGLSAEQQAYYTGTGDQAVIAHQREGVVDQPGMQPRHQRPGRDGKTQQDHPS